jgi:hypothetical protein
MATYDGDTVPIAVTNMTGFFLPPGERVYILIIPPSGNFIVGFAGEMQQLSRGQVDWVATTANSAFVAAETVVLTGASVIFRAGRAYEVISQCVTDGSIASNSAGYRVRRTNLAGTLLIGPVDYLMNTTLGISQESGLRWVVVNATSADITDNLVLTLAASSGGPDTVSSRAGGAARPRFMEIYDIGAAADYPGANQI